MTGEYKDIRISPRRGPVIVARARPLAEATTATPGKPQWQEAALWETEGGNWIAELRGVTDGRGAIIDAEVIAPMPDEMERKLRVMDALDWTPLARRMVREQLGWDLKVRVA